ncbi:MAG: DUF5683 domain-containing protein [Candidatus Poribacteria bacterium]|nr:DUF5683 domain-containing protein [Candidatus Poribacteria bacterium]MDE0504819.1 DUF5683 domain-containing protein [Candidatus Poribacteria bacterium]
MKILTIVLFFLAFAQVCFSQTDELRLISPIGSVVRSAFVPGWGQFHSRSPIRGTLSVIGVGACLSGALVAHNSFLNIYNNQYIPAATIDPKSEEAAAQYKRSNERYKVRQFFLYAAIGVWAYSVIDSYVGAKFYNAKIRVDSLIEEAKEIEKLGVSVDATPTKIALILNKSF